MDNLPERAYGILELLAADPNLTQRALARQSGISHGLANIILRRCMRIGLVKAKSVDGRRLRYFVTPRGLRHVMQRSVQYVQKTLDSYRTLRQGIESLLKRLQAEGKSHFVVVGEGDIVHIVEDALKSRGDVTFESVRSWNGVAGRKSARTGNGRRAAVDGSPVAILDCRWNGGDIGVSVLHEILFSPPAPGPGHSPEAGAQSRHERND
ncbi:MAG: winged helix-turn-helix transcriptional regulator [Nitrospirae bacterium]|nr:winged helix-turn-helix transcriptional regulator [Nitrospirota bacterium]